MKFSGKIFDLYIFDKLKGDLNKVKTKNKKKLKTKLDNLRFHFSFQPLELLDAIERAVGKNSSS